MIAAVIFLSFVGGFLLIQSVVGFSKRNRIKELLNRKQKSFKMPTRQIGRKISGFFDINRIDGILHLAKNPLGMDGETYLGLILIAMFALFVLGFSLWAAHITGPLPVIALPFLGYGVPRYITHKKAEEARRLLRINLMDFCSQMEQAVTGGAVPLRVVSWVAEGDSFFAQQMNYVKESAEKGTPLSRAIAEHFCDKLGIAEAAELAAILRSSEQRGTPVAEMVRELNRDFRRQRTDEMDVQISRLKPGMTGILTLVTILAMATLIAGPVIWATIRTLHSI